MTIFHRLFTFNINADHDTTRFEIRAAEQRKMTTLFFSDDKASHKRVAIPNPTVYPLHQDRQDRYKILCVIDPQFRKKKKEVLRTRLVDWVPRSLDAGLVQAFLKDPGTRDYIHRDYSLQREKRDDLINVFILEWVCKRQRILCSVGSHVRIFLSVVSVRSSFDIRRQTGYPIYAVGDVSGCALDGLRIVGRICEGASHQVFHRGRSPIVRFKVSLILRTI